jgi:hypothetical protein
MRYSFFAILRRYLRDGNLFRDNAAEDLGLSRFRLIE